MNSVTPTFSIETLTTLLQHHYQLDGELTALASYCDQNLLLVTAQQRYVVKVANSAEKKIELMMQNDAMTHLSSNELPVPQVVKNQDDQQITDIVDTQQNTFYMRVLTYLPGDFYAQANQQNMSSTLWQNLGHFMAKVANTLSDFKHQGAYRYFDWDLAHGYAICQDKKQHLAQDQKPLVEYFLSMYQAHVTPNLAKLPCSVIHNDANDHNLLVDQTNTPSKITGLIDFGDMVYSQTINELAITAAYAMMEQADPLTTLVNTVAGFHEHYTINDDEFDTLPYLIALRLCTSVCNAANAIKEQPNNDYLLVSVKPAWQLLSLLKEVNFYAITCRLKVACGVNPDQGKTKAEIKKYREKHLGKTLSLSFKEPLKIVRGQGAYLYDEQGNRYLDMVNNVCHVGHCHPKVVAAGQAQMAKLNTNTRFLHDNLVNYAEKLLATMPEPLSVCMFVNSGSEANELAFRLAKNYTGSTELLTVEGAYHGNTNACINASPYKFDGPGGEGAKDYVHKVMLPDPYRGKYQGNTADSATAYAEDVQRAINELAEHGKKPGMFICESLQGVAGQIIMPEGYLQAVYAKVRDAGGVCIADEVQVGFGRVGSHMWAFETQEVVPDIVTLGKPIGNGHPMAAVITTQEIADAFVTGMEYFNTFGGNPVSCAIGAAVLDVITEEQLMENAKQTGDYLQHALRKLQQAFDVIGDVRGIGLFIGVELVENRNTKAPATDLTASLVEFMKTQQIILSTEGPFYNILKIKPPIVFNKQDADTFINALTLGLQTLVSD
ncbi:aminotransferase class III-fold pyridoxal phosphate-dependent enzyme [Thalassotalea sp. 1_MG-2023]|uniref:aminotransferase class III-fold pyridoxal phosphate-dependent enzyme n=1 Tax=Thalassotalea sp. 1_MG-2023 TaxID=3062680 RepID=UPI0026E48C97|nr:aminotransferase class III-fold pyridoxal phosphate-dependent enzyme [Thalassotalea sp. 1_MG-2023]MDO6427000.1 aminotransferase class III-fold pyridoxal phosphate-dependent enzyme [Thalassotalea sp. 1_MG-2023]